jgi:hypothetical protein
VPLAGYTTADVKREFVTAKSCSPNCTIGCVHRISYIDHWRAPQTRTVSPGGHGAETPELVKIQPPAVGQTALARPDGDLRDEPSLGG